MNRAFETARYALLIVLFVSAGACATQRHLIEQSPPTAAVPDAPPAPDSSTILRAGLLQKMDVLPPQKIDVGTLWLARCIYSETKKPKEQRLVAWVLRNRVETEYRGSDSYREAVLDPYQFSAFNPGSPTRSFYINLDEVVQLPGWQRALRIAHTVRHLPDAARPFPIKTRHFFSQRSMPGHRYPDWANDRKLISLEEFEIDKHRFRFYSGIS